MGHSIGSNNQRDNILPENVSFVVHHRVRAGELPQYEAWLDKIIKVASTFQGHKEVQVVRPTANGVNYTIIVGFSSLEDATRWQQSIERKNLIDAAQPYLEVAEQTSLGSGIDYMFGSKSTSLSKPPTWKQWLITTSVIWPLTMIVPWVLSPVFETLPILGGYGIRQGIVASIIVALVVWIIMPRYSKLVHKWLFNNKS